MDKALMVPVNVHGLQIRVIGFSIMPATSSKLAKAGALNAATLIQLHNINKITIFRHHK